MAHARTQEHKRVAVEPHKVTYTVHFIPEEVGGYSVIVPALPGCYSQGESLVEAEHFAIEAIQLYLASLQDTNEAAPEETSTAIERYFASFATDVPPLPGSEPMVWKRLEVPVDSL